MRTLVVGAIAAGLVTALVSVAPATAAVPVAVLNYKFDNLAGDVVRDSSPS